MLWDAGQQRVTREGRERLAELYVGVRDGYLAGEVAIGRAKVRGDALPAYARGPELVRDPAARTATLARLAAMFPGAVREGRA
jgi:hypothetical protein